ncbi:MAG: hypothetical protein AB8C84_11715 [Oligoflexales bacterium]
MTALAFFSVRKKIFISIFCATGFSSLSFASPVCFPENLQPLDLEEAFTNEDLYTLKASSCFEKISKTKTPEAQAIRAVTTGRSSNPVLLFGYQWQIQRPEIYKSKYGITVKGTLYHVGKIQRPSKIEYQFTYSGDGANTVKQSLKILPGSSEKNPFTYLDNAGKTKKLAWFVDLGLQTIGLSNVFINREVIEDLGKTILANSGEEEKELTWQEHTPSLVKALADRSYLWHLYLLNKAKLSPKSGFHIR